MNRIIKVLRITKIYLGANKKAKKLNGKNH